MTMGDPKKPDGMKPEELERDYGVKLGAMESGLNVDFSVISTHAKQLLSAVDRLRFVWQAFPVALRTHWVIHLRIDGTVDVERGE